MADNTQSAPPAGSARSWFVTAAKLLVGVSLIAAVLWTVDLAVVAQTLPLTDVRSLVVALSLFVLSRFLEALRLYVVTSGFGCRLRRSLEILFISTFFNNFAVTIVGDSYKVVALRGEIGSWQASTVVVVAERLLGVVAIGCIGLAVFMFSPDAFAPVGDVSVQWDRVVVIAAAFIVAGLVAAIVVFRRQRYRDSIRNSLRHVTDNVGSWQVALGLAITVAAQLALAGMVYVLVFSFGGIVGFRENLLVMLVVYVAAYVPISVGSLGVREGAIVVGLGWYGVAAPISLAAALTSRMLIYLVAALAGAWWVLRRRARKPSGS